MLKRDRKTYLQVHVLPSRLRYSFPDTGELVDHDRVGLVVRLLTDVGMVEVEAAHTSGRTQGRSYELVERRNMVDCDWFFGGGLRNVGGLI